MILLCIRLQCWVGEGYEGRWVRKHRMVWQHLRNRLSSSSILLCFAKPKQHPLRCSGIYSHSWAVLWCLLGCKIVARVKLLRDACPNSPFFLLSPITDSCKKKPNMNKKSEECPFEITSLEGGGEKGRTVAFPALKWCFICSPNTDELSTHTGAFSLLHPKLGPPSPHSCKRPRGTERLSCLWLKRFLCQKQRAKSIRSSRSNYWQGLGSADAWVNIDCSFHQIPNRNNNSSTVLDFSLRSSGEGAGCREVGGKMTVRPCFGGGYPDPATAGPSFWHRQCQLRGEKPSLSYHFLNKPSEEEQKHC